LPAHFRLRAPLLSLAVSIAGGAIAQTAGTPNAPAGGGSAASVQSLESITISATRRREPAREVPMQVDTLSAEQLQQSGAKDLADYLADQPGVDVKNNGGAGTGAINIRGVSTGDQTISTVGVYVDDVAIGSSSAYAAGATTALDMSLLDLHHIELLRGPQGTLYGAGAMGGLLKYVTNDPSTYDFTGKISLGLSQARGGQLGYTESAVINIPLKEDVAGLRVAAFSDHVGGYINAVGPAAGSHINGGDTTGARASLLFYPSSGLRMKFTAMQQDIRRDSADFADYDPVTRQPLYGAGTRQLAVREPFGVRVSLASADIEYDLGWARLNSITSTQRVQVNQRSDYSFVYGPAVGLPVVIADLHAKVDRATQEFRLTSTTGGQFEWLAGLYYNKERGSNFQTDTGLSSGDLLFADIPSHYKEEAVYGDATWNFSKAFAVTVGARVARNTQDYVVAADGLLVGGPVTLVGSSAETSRTYLFTAKYALSPTSNVYTRIASGYRPGGPNPVLNDAQGHPLVPPMFQHDSLWSYEAGYKADLLDKTLSVRAAAYEIRWNQIQQYFAVNGVNVIVNGGKAKVDGGELALTWRPTTQLSVAGGLALNDARLTEDAPGLALSGTRLPNTPRASANFAVTYNFPLAGNAAYVGLSGRLVGGHDAGFPGNAALPAYRLSGYGLLDVQTGIAISNFDLALYVRNLADRRAQVAAQTNLVAAGVGGPAMVMEARPRTVGATLSVKF
jgi:outer membrane receptor protein involved in Fe transport